MKKENLFVRIAIGFAIGILLGLFAPGFSISTKIVGDIYLRLIKFMVLPVLVCAVMTGIINSANIKSLRRVAVKTVALFFVMFLASFAVSSVVAMSIRPGQGIVFENQPVYEGTIAGKLSAADVLRQLFPSSLEDIFSSKNILVTIILAIILAVVIVRMGEKAEHVKDFINRLSDIVFRILSVIMETSPIGVMSLIAFSIAEYGAGLFMAIGKYILCCWLACMAVFIIVFMLPVILYTKTDLKTYLRACGRVALPNLGQRLATTLGYVVFASMINSLGGVSTAAHTVANTVESLFYIPGYGMQTAAATLSGNAYGARDHDRLKRLGGTVIRLELALMIVSGSLLFLFAEPLVRIFSSDENVIRLGTTVLRMVAVSEPFYGIPIVVEGLMQGVGRTVAPFVYNVAGMWAVRIAGTFICIRCFGLGLVAAWGCMISHNLVLFVLFARHYLSGRWDPFYRQKTV